MDALDSRIAFWFITVFVIALFSLRKFSDKPRFILTDIALSLAISLVITEAIVFSTPSEDPWENLHF